MAELPLTGAIARFIDNEARLDTFLDEKAAIVASIATKAPQTAVDALETEIAGLKHEFTTEISRPGGTSLGYTNDQLGGPGTPPGVSTTNARGATRRITGNQLLSTDRKFPVISGLSWTVTVSLQRVVDPTIVSGAIVRVIVRWLNNVGALVSAVTVWPVPTDKVFLVADEVALLNFTVGRNSDYQPPAGATDFVINVVTLDVDGQTDVDLIHVVPRDQDLVNRIQSLQPTVILTMGVTPTVIEAGSNTLPVVSWTLDPTRSYAEQRINGNVIDVDARDWSPASPLNADGTYMLEVTDSLDRVYVKTVTVDFAYRAYWGVSTLPGPLTGAQILSLGNSGLVSDSILDTVLDPAGEKYGFFAWPQTLGQYNTYELGGFDVTPVTANGISVTTPAGFTGNYRTVRTPQLVNAPFPIKVT
jgi:hypothetical protein